MKKLFLFTILFFLPLTSFGYQWVFNAENNPSNCGTTNITYMGTFLDRDFYNVEAIAVEGCTFINWTASNLYLQYFKDDCGTFNFPTNKNPLISTCNWYGFTMGVKVQQADTTITANFTGEPAPVGVPSLFSVPMASSSDMVASVGTLFTDLWVLISIVAGLPLAFYVIRRVIMLV